MEIDFPYSLSDHGCEVAPRDPRAVSAEQTRHQGDVARATRAKFTGKYLVVKIDGELTLGNGRAQFKGEDPGFLWRNRAKDYIQGKLAKYLDPKATPQSDELPDGS